MGAFDSWPSALGQAIGGLGLAQQQLGNYSAATATANTWGYDYDFARDVLARKADGDVVPNGGPLKPESAVMWLDRRVSEICVKL